jgi:hypothetical protein
VENWSAGAHAVVQVIAVTTRPDVFTAVADVEVSDEDHVDVPATVALTRTVIVYLVPRSMVDGAETFTERAVEPVAVFHTEELVEPAAVARTSKLVAGSVPA